ncbi:MAG: ACP S-malonyltransferase [Actinomycetota bacterium]
MDKVALMFPGQGSQRQGMGIDFINKNPRYADYFKQCSRAVGEDIIDIISGDSGKLDKTEYSQPAIYSLSCALFDYLDSTVSISGSAGAAIGHSLGDYSALYGCGAYGFKKGLELVVYRSRLMAEENRKAGGMMAAVLGVGPERIERIIDEFKLGIYIANYNHYSQTVVSGSRNRVREAVRVFKENGIRKVIPLRVGVASHCPLMAGVSKRLREYMDKNLDVGEFRIPFYSSTADDLISKTEVKKNLEEQLIKPIRWVDSINTLMDRGFDTFIEIGPKDVLGKLVKGIALQNKSRVDILKSEDTEQLVKKIKGGSLS